MVALPKSFPAGTTFWDVEDVPVSRSKFEATAWDKSGGRPFPDKSVERNGAELSEALFRDWVSTGVPPWDSSGRRRDLSHASA